MSERQRKYLHERSLIYNVSANDRLKQEIILLLGFCAGFLYFVALCLGKVEMSTPTFDEALRAGAVCFNRGKFFKAHEKWEERWLLETGDAKRFLHGLIQIAAGFVKINIKEWPSADGLFEEAQTKLEGLPAAIYGVELEPLLGAVARCQGEVRLILRGVFDSFDLSQIPQLELTE